MINGLIYIIKSESQSEDRVLKFSKSSLDDSTVDTSWRNTDLERGMAESHTWQCLGADLAWCSEHVLRYP